MHTLSITGVHAGTNSGPISRGASACGSSSAGLGIRAKALTTLLTKAEAEISKEISKKYKLGLIPLDDGCKKKVIQVPLYSSIF